MSVESFACNRLHPQVPEVYCDRQRFHAGDHRANANDRLYEWADMPLEPAGRGFGKTHAATPFEVSDGADLDPFEGLEVTELEGHVHRDAMWWAYALLTVWILLIAPPVLVILYREAF